MHRDGHLHASTSNSMTTLPHPMPSAEQDAPPGMDRACSEHAAAFLAKTSPNERFTLALTNVLPRLNEADKPAEKILAAYLLHSMYHTVDIELNPFRGALAEAFAREQAAGAHHQLVWVLWKIVRGQGQDLAELSPNQLATSTLADECHPTQLHISNQSPRASTDTQPRPPVGTPLISTSDFDEVGLTHSTSLVDPDDSFVADHNEPQLQEAVGVIGSGKALGERPSSVATTRPDDRPPAPSNNPAALMLPGLVSPPQNDDQERQVKTYASALELLASACCRVLNLTEQRTLKPLLPNFAYPVPVLSPSDLSSLIAYNPAIAASYLSCIISRSSALTMDPAADSTLWLAVTTRLPPTLASFDFFGRMLRDELPVVKPSDIETPRFMSLGSASAVASSHNGEVDLLPAGLLSPDPAPPPSTSRAAASVAALGSNMTTTSGHGLGFGTQGSSKREKTVSDVVREEALGAFISGCIAWIEHAEQEEREGLVADDRVLRGIQGLCRFFSSLLKLQLIDPRSDAATAEMASFVLAHSRFEDALGVYRLLASARSG